MKKQILLFALLFSISILNAQEIVKNEVDEFTGKTVKVSNWEVLNKSSKLYSYVRIQQVDELYYFDFKFMASNDVYTVTEGENLMLKLNDESILKLYNPKLNISNYGEGSIGIAGSKMFGMNITCALTKEQLLELSNHEIIKTRIQTESGYFENEVKMKQAKKVKELIQLFI